MSVATVCRSCGSAELLPVLDLGVTPLANSLLTERQVTHPEPVFPLVLAFCPACSLAQLTVSVPPETMFLEYAYFSSFSDTMLRHASAIATRMTKARALGPSSLVVEIASNDGYLLRNYVASGIPVLGIEPAANIAQVALDTHRIPTLCDFFGRDLAERLAAAGKRADVVHANNVLAHVPDLNGFVAGIAAILKPDGVAIVEAPYVVDMIDSCEFDTIYHEHLCYFSATALDRLFSRHGLTIVDVERVSIHGGSLRVFAAPSGGASKPSPEVLSLLGEETRRGADRIDFYQSFARRVDSLKRSLVDLIRDLRARDRRIAAYGASAKGSTLMNACGLTRDMLDFVVDRNTYKQGLYTPGLRLKISPPARLLEDRPDYTLLLTWNFKEEILEQQIEYRRLGGRFIVPIPQPTVI
jgi:SAM-dependent methyltransferase